MKRTWSAAVLSICFGLLLATTWLLLTPPPVFAATGTVDRSGRKIVSCAAQACYCHNGYGCDACNQQPDGKWKCVTTRCRSSDELEEEGQV